MRQNYVKSLDGLRCYAVFLVLILHGTYGQFPGGWVGVDLFFVISGYLITWLLMVEVAETGRIRLVQFYTRRALRLIPALIFAVLLAGCLWPLVPNSDASMGWPSASVCVLMYASNLVPPGRLGPLSHCWSLAVEEHYYLVWPPIFLATWRQWGRIGTLCVALIGIVGVVWFRLGSAGLLAAEGLDPYSFTLSRADTLLIGSIAAVLLPPCPDPKARTSGVLCALIILFGITFSFFVYPTNRWVSSSGFSIIAIVASVLVITASRPSPIGQFLEVNPLVWIGKRSYGIYIYHFPIFLATEVLRIKGSLPNFIEVTGLRFGSTILIAAISYRIIERPFLALKSRLGHAAIQAPQKLDALEQKQEDQSKTIDIYKIIT